MVTSIIDLFLGSLLLTNIWIFLYTKILIFLNFHFPAKVNQQFLWVQSAQEPFEISLYLILTLLFVLAILFFHKSKKTIFYTSFRLKIFIIVALSILLIYFIGGYPMAGEFDPYPVRSSRSIYLIVTIVYILTIASLSFINVLIHRILKKQYIINIVIYSIVLLSIGLVTFDARFPMAGHDYEYFIGPVTEVLGGKTVYTDVLSRYAFLTIDFLAVLHKIGVFSLFYLPFIVWILYILQYFSLFYLIKKMSRSFEFAILGLASIMTVNYFSLSHLPSVIPQIGPLRWLPMIILILIVYKTKKLNSLLFMTVLSFLSLLMIDVGTAMILSYIASLGLLCTSGKIKLLSFIKNVLQFCIIFFVTLLVVNIVHLAFGYKFVDIFNIIYSFKKHAVLGLSLIPMAKHTYFWLVPLIYFASIVYMFKEQKNSHHVGGMKGRGPASAQIGRYSPPVEHLWEGISGQNLHDIVLIFSANLSFFASIYFVGRSHPHNLFNISLFPLLNLFLLFSIFYSNIKVIKTKVIVLALLFLMLIIFPAYKRSHTLTEMILTKISRLRSGNIFKSEVEEIINNKYKNDIALINNHMEEDKTVILSVDDAYLFYALGKKNLLDANPIMGIDLPEDLDFAVKSVVKSCPKKIAADCSFISKCPSYTPFIGVNFNLRLILDKLETGCQIKYKPSICSKHLCIMDTTDNSRF